MRSAQNKWQKLESKASVSLLAPSPVNTDAIKKLHRNRVGSWGEMIHISSVALTLRRSLVSKLLQPFN